MYYTAGNTVVRRHAQAVDPELAARLNWLAAAHEREREAELCARIASVEHLAWPFADAVSARDAFARFGARLALFPPAAIFLRLLWEVSDASALYWLLPLAGLMNLVCYEVGRAAAARFATAFERVEGSHFYLRLFLPGLLGMLWGMVTGAAGGAPFFGFGAFFGAVAAALVGAFGFTLFSALHRMFSRGGMIEARHLRALALVVNALIVALILLM